MEEGRVDKSLSRSRPKIKTKLSSSEYMKKDEEYLKQIQSDKEKYNSDVVLFNTNENHKMIQ